MNITDTILQTTYEYLMQIKPFNKWKLPPSCEIEFKVINDKELMGMFEPEPYCISISKARHDHLDTILKTMAHEMCHLKLYLDGYEKYELHNKDFNKLSKQVAKEFGFDYKEL